MDSPLAHHVVSAALLIWAAVGGPNRSPIGAATEKKWEPLVLGTLDLPAGRIRLTVKAMHKAGATVMDLKGVRLRKIED